jgi:hypothetical protein
VKTLLHLKEIEKRLPRDSRRNSRRTTIKRLTNEELARIENKLTTRINNLKESDLLKRIELLNRKGGKKRTTRKK